MMRLFLVSFLTTSAALPAADRTLTGSAALGDWSTDAPGVRRRITTKDVARPYATKSAWNFPRVVARPEGAWPKAPAGFVVELFAEGFKQPRIVQVAPNGDVFVAESKGDRLRMLRPGPDGKVAQSAVFVDGLRRPFGIAFHPPGPEPKFLYIGNTDSVVRVPYRNGDLKAGGPPERLVDLPTGGALLAGGGHWTRDLAFSRDGSKMYVSIGSASNVDDDAAEARRARILVFDPQGKNERVFASGLRNPVGLAIEPATGSLWSTVNERDGLGEDIPPDYVTRVQEGGFYGWPWFYLGPNQDPRHAGKRPELRSKVLVPDVLLQSHSAALGLAFYRGNQFPPEYRGQAFVALHGSWNRARRTGYKIVRLGSKGGKPTGEYTDFLIGFVTPGGDVWGRPVGVAVMKDGSLLVSDDAGNCLWRVRYAAKPKT